MNKLQPKHWKRINPDFFKEQDFRLKRLVFDGDHARQNNNVLRNRFTVQDMMDSYIESEEFFLKKAKEEQELESFKEKALKEGISIQLKDVTDSLFIESNHMNAFWKVCFELHKKQKKEN